MFENPRRGRRARNFTANAPKILDLKSSSEQIFSRKLTLGAPDGVDRQLSNGLKFNRQPSRKVSFSPSTVRSFKVFQISLFHPILMDVWPLKKL